jgi:sugar/nucleoside kinase (ribokinase family)
MQNISPIDSIDYLVVGHITCDITPDGLRLGGTSAYAALTAQSLGLRVGIVTAWGEEVSIQPLAGIPLVNFPCESSTIFENQTTPEGRRVQMVHKVAPQLEFHMIPEAWRSASIVHLGPVAQEVDPSMIRYFPSALIGLTPQGWLREWDQEGRISTTEWPEATYILGQAGGVVISQEDVGYDEARIEELASYCRVLAVTEAENGARLYWNADVRRFRPPTVRQVDPTGAGDIFAAAFFVRLHTTRDPWEAARFATQLSALSVTRPGLEGIPTPEEIAGNIVEVY